MARAAGAGRGGRGLGDAGLHPSADRAAGDLGPSHAGLCRDAGARPGPVRRCARADERMPAGRGGAGRHVVSDRPATRRRAALGFDRPMANSLDAVSDRDFALEFLAAAQHLRGAPEPAGRRAGDLVVGAVPLRDPVGPVLHRSVDHAAEEEPRRGRADPRQDRPHRRRQRGAADGDEGAAAGLFQGHAGGQGAGVRRRRHADAGAGGDGPAWCAT